MTRPVRFLRARPVGMLSLLCVLACGSCGTGGVVASQDAVSGLKVTPGMTSLPPGGTGTFVAVAQGAFATGVQAVSAGVVWTASGGSISGAGLYTAPTQLGSYQIQATYAGKTGLATANVVPPGTPGALYGTASASCANLPLRSTGTIRYFCDCQSGSQGGCVAGNDANTGTSPSSPKQTWAQVVSMFNAMSGGDTIALCQGGAWSTSAAATFTNTRCAPAADIGAATNTTTCDLRDYQPPWGGTAKPIIRQTAVANLLQFWNAAQQGIRVLNLDLEGGGAGPGAGADVGQRAINTSDGATDVFVCNNTINGWYLGFHMYPYTTPSVARHTIRGNRFTMNRLDAFLGGGSNSTIDANFFDNNGSYNATTHSVYLQGTNVTNFSVVNNEFRRSGAPSVCAGVIVVVHDQFDGLNIENNIVDGGFGAGGSCWGISPGNGGYATAGWYKNMSIRRNYLTNVGYGIVIEEAPSAVIENNILVLALSNMHAIIVPWAAARTSLGEPITTDVTVRNNTVYFLSSGSSASRAIDVGTGGSGTVNEGTGYIIANNAIFFAGSGGSCLSVALPTASFAYIDHNQCNGYANWEATRGSLAAWRTYSGNLFDMNSLTSAPQFTNAPSDLTPALGSPLIGDGDAAQAPVYDFTLRTRSNPPSIGALEH